MTDSLKFGPEWLRNMKPENGANTSSTTSTATIKMAEFRYGREEMLALFDRSVLAPDSLKQIQGLHIEKTQPPLALIQMTDEETRMWNRGINSDAVLRLSSNKPGGPGENPRGSLRGGVMGGRGGSVDRGRGRGRGAFHYTRGYEDTDGYNSNSSYSRSIRGFDRTQSSGPSQWSERNGGGLGVDHGDWAGSNMSTSPRKEYSGRSMSDTNWRRHRGSGEEEDGWRSTKHEKWTRSTSWRDGDSSWETNRGSSGPTRSWDDGSSAPSSRKTWDGEDNSLPEWATENPSDSGGSFDATGAFHGGGVYSDEEEDANHSGTTRETRKESQLASNHKSTGNKETSSVVNGTSQVDRLDGDRSNKSNTSGPGLRQSQSASSISSSTTLPERKTSVPARSSTSTNLSVLNTKSKPKSSEKLNEEEKVLEPPTPAVHIKIESPIKTKPFSQPEVVVPQPPDKSDEAMLRMQEAANDLVAKLMEDEERDPPKHPVVQNISQPPATSSNLADTDKWYYRDPQGMVQGPFLSSEMAEWYKTGYFNLNLQVRRACDERYSPLGELMNLWGNVPFLVNANIPPIKANDNIPVLPTLPVPSIPPTLNPIDDTALIQFHIHQHQLMLKKESLVKQLRLIEPYKSLSPVDLQAVVDNYIKMETMGMLNNYMPSQHPLQPPQQPTPPQSHPTTHSSVLAVMQQLHQQQQQAQVSAPPITEPPRNPITQQSIDPVQLIQQIGLQSQPALASQLHQKPAEEQRGPEQQFLNLFANIQKPSQSVHPQTVKPIDSVWGSTTTTPSYNPSWPLPPVPPGQLPQSLWGELQTKGMKTEQEVLEEQLRAEEERKKEEHRKQEELQRLKEEEEERARRKLEEEEALERKRKEEDERQRERKRLKEEEDRKKQEAAAKKAEQERLKKEEEKKRKEDEKRKKEEEKRRKEELKRKQEEEKRKLEEEKKKLEEERKRQEEEVKRAEQAKRQAEALKRLQEQQQQTQARAVVKPSSTPAWTAAETISSSTSLSEIQKTERKQQQQLKEQQQLLQMFQQQQQQQQLLQERTNNNKSNSSLNLKWADTKKPTTRVKSLAEIQAEEQEQLAKQTEREKAERIAQAKEVPIPATSSIWANQNLTWNTPNSSSAWGNSTATGGSSGPGFWDEVVPPTTVPKAPSKNKTNASAVTNAANKPAVTKNRAKKEEITVLKLFEQQPKFDDFYNWCSKRLSTMQSSVDIPTFVQFLRDIEQPVEVHEYVRMYLGDGKEATEFASQFIDRRARAKTGEPQRRMDNCATSMTNNFQEVKGKNKKVKKGKMMRVDNRILGFSVTASQDRFNVGDRDYGENI